MLYPALLGTLIEACVFISLIKVCEISARDDEEK
jgi:hypothetical protein